VVLLRHGGVLLFPLRPLAAGRGEKTNFANLRVGAEPGLCSLFGKKNQQQRKRLRERPTKHDSAATGSDDSKSENQGNDPSKKEDTMQIPLIHLLDDR